MSERRMFLIPVELVQKIDEHRGEMDQSEFIEYLIDSRLNEARKEKKVVQYATREEVHSFEQDIKILLKNFLDFFLTYGMELGKQSISPEFAELTNRLQDLEKDLSKEAKEKLATIKWK